MNNAPRPSLTRSDRLRHHRQQRGAATLAVSLLLLLAMLLSAAYANRALLFEQRSSANQQRATQAFEAAEAGIDWAIAQLNAPQPVDEHCGPSDDARGASFRERYLSVDTDSGLHTPQLWKSGMQDLALQPGCVRSDNAWSCACPSNGWPSLVAATGDDLAPQPAFSVQFSAEPRPGLVRLTAIGCSNAAGACRPGVAGRADAVVRLQVLLGALPGVSVLPQAALTVRGTVEATGALGVHNTDAASGGLTVRAGGSLIGTAVRLGTAAGGAAEASAATHDSALAAIAPERLFASHFGLDRTRWARHPAAQAVDCTLACGPAIAAAIDAVGSNRMVSIAGDAAIDGPLTLGSAERPVILVVSGTAALRGDVTLHGVLYAVDIRWDGPTGAPAGVHGAVISESDYRGNGAPRLQRDAEVLRALQRHTGSFARVPGSWKDY
jgi:hypothetical protein